MVLLLLQRREVADEEDDAAAEDLVLCPEDDNVFPQLYIKPLLVAMATFASPLNVSPNFIRANPVITICNIQEDQHHDN